MLCEKILEAIFEATREMRRKSFEKEMNIRVKYAKLMILLVGKEGLYQDMDEPNRDELDNCINESSTQLKEIIHSCLDMGITKSSIIQILDSQKSSVSALSTDFHNQLISELDKMEVNE